jgi:hypothetical protein
MNAALKPETLSIADYLIAEDKAEFKSEKAL